LHPVRLHFAGRFRGDVSTVNNVASRFENGSFNSDFQKPLSGANDRSNWQPAGTGAWRLLDCRVTRHYRSDGTFASTPGEDIAVSLAVRGSGDRSSAKIVDLDPEQQGVSMIFGLTVCLVDDRGRILMQGEFDPAAFFDLRSNRSPGGGDAGRSAYFQSVLTNVTWGDIAASPCLTQLRQASAAQKLSIRFIADGYQMRDPQRGYGRVVGTIGPYIDGEPKTFVVGRHLQVQTAAGPPAPEYAQVDCRVDAERRKVLVDVGNILKVKPNGDFSDLGDITLTAGNGIVLGALNYKGDGSYANTAGIYELPPDRTLTDAELTAATQNPLQLMLRPPGAAAPQAFASEKADGFYVRPEQFVFRLDPGASAQTDLIVTRFGVPSPNATPAAIVTPYTGMVPQDQQSQLPVPDFTVGAKTDGNGRARLSITAVNPGDPRQFVDGLVYAIVCSVQESPADPQVALNSDGNFISVLIFDSVPVLAAPGWDDVRPIFKQYADLYPRPHGPDPYAPFDGLPPSHPVVNLEDYEEVARFARRIQKALELPIEDPNHMPVTRDLSGAKRKLLLNWLRNVGTDGKPKKGGSPAVAAPMVARATASPARVATSFPKFDISLRRHRPPGD
jgi:hypothetical protein